MPPLWGRGAARGDANTTALELERLDYAEQAVSTLSQTAEMLRPVEGRRKAILYVGEGIDYELGDRTLDLMQQVNAFVSAVSRSGTVLYTLDPGGMRAPALGVDSPAGSAFSGALDDAGARAYSMLQAWASGSGGVAAIDTNDLDGGLARIVEDSSRYYVLAFDSPTANDGRFHRVEVRTTRPGVKVVRAGRGYLAGPKPNAKAAAKTVSAEHARAASLDEALSSPVPRMGARLRVFAAPFKGTTAEHEALVGLHLDGRDLGLTGQEGAEQINALVEIVVLDEAGRVAASTRNTLDVTVPPGRAQAVQSRGLRYLDRVALPPGRYRVRAGAVVGGDRIGTVESSLEVQDFTAPNLALSGLLVSSRRAAPGLSTGSYYTTWLPGPATAQRRFLPDDELTAFAELYNAGTTERFIAVQRVLDGQGDVMLESTQALAAPQSSRDTVPVVATVPLRSLAPGRYRLRVEIRPDRDAGVTVAREVTFHVTERTEPD